HPCIGLPPYRFQFQIVYPLLQFLIKEVGFFESCSKKFFKAFKRLFLDLVGKSNSDRYTFPRLYPSFKTTCCLSSETVFIYGCGFLSTDDVVVNAIFYIGGSVWDIVKTLIVCLVFTEQDFIGIFEIHDITTVPTVVHFNGLLGDTSKHGFVIELLVSPGPGIPKPNGG